ncbi:MAG TPA: NAD-dependent epimerase/dehydratase family protein [Vicinamibacterales bacterium]|nr:NAD-dependent epimerase/dehydratase family protein [Vicinamibacterales bacterium]
MQHRRQRILVAGAGGTLGLALAKRLVEAGHEVIGWTRSPAKLGFLHALGARGRVVDALDARAVRALVLETRPEQVVNLLTALPPAGALRPADLEPTNRLRRHASANILRAALEAGVRRVVAESFAAVWGEVDLRRPLVEADALGSIARTIRWRKRCARCATSSGSTSTPPAGSRSRPSFCDMVSSTARAWLRRRSCCDACEGDSFRSPRARVPPRGSTSTMRSPRRRP